MANYWKVDSLNLILQNNMSISKVVCVAMCLGLGLSFSVTAGGRNSLSAPGDKLKRAAEEDRQSEDSPKNDGLQQTLNLNFSPEHRERLRKALERKPILIRVAEKIQSFIDMFVEGMGGV